MQVQANSRASQLIGDRYRVLRRCGAGSYAAVFECADERVAGRRVAIKISKRADDESRLLFQRQFTLIDQFGGTILSRVYDYAEVGSERRPMLVMELLEGAELGTWAKARSARERVGLFALVLEETRRLRELGIVHGDLKEDNVLVVGDRPRFVDPDPELWGSSESKRRGELDRVDPDRSGLLRIFAAIFTDLERAALHDLETRIRKRDLDSASLAVASGSARIEVLTLLGADAVASAYATGLEERKKRGAELRKQRREAIFSTFALAEGAVTRLFGTPGTRPTLKVAEHEAEEMKGSLNDGARWQLAENMQMWILPEGEKFVVGFNRGHIHRAPWAADLLERNLVADGYVWLQEPNTSSIGSWTLVIEIPEPGREFVRLVRSNEPARPFSDGHALQNFDAHWLLSMFSTLILSRR